MTTADRYSEAHMTSVPSHLRGSLHRYLIAGTPPGHFLTAVLQHDLFEAMARADEDSREGLHGLVRFIYTKAPAACHGSRGAVQAWMAAGGLSGPLYGEAQAQATMDVDFVAEAVMEPVDVEAGRSPEDEERHRHE